MTFGYIVPEGDHSRESESEGRSVKSAAEASCEGEGFCEAAIQIIFNQPPTRHI